MREAAWPSAACWSLFEWLEAWGVPALVPVHLRGTLEDRGDDAIVSTRDCAFQSDLAYSWLGLSRTHEATDDFFLSSGRGNEGGSSWGFGLKSGDIVTFIQVVSGSFNEGFTPDVRPFSLFMERLWEHVNEPSLLDRPIASVTFSELRQRHAIAWAREPDDAQQPVGAQSSDLGARAYAARKVEAVQRFADELNALTNGSAK